MTQAKPVLFVDYNKVISYDNFWKSLEDTSHPLHDKLPEIENFLFQQNNQLIKEWMVGGHTSETIHRLIADNVGVDYTTLLKIFIEDCKNLDAPPSILNALDSLKEKYIRILRTDNMDSFTRFTLPANLDLQNAFDKIVNSFELQELKTDNGGRYFLDTASKYGVDISACILIDDSEKNCNLFKSIGGQAYQATGEDNVTKILVDLYA